MNKIHIKIFRSINQAPPSKFSPYCY